MWLACRKPTFVHSQQIDTLQNADVQFDQRVTALENGSLASNNTGSQIETLKYFSCNIM